MNYDEQANLVALMWVGRGTYEKEEFEEAVETARAERINATSTYCLAFRARATDLNKASSTDGLSVDWDARFATVIDPWRSRGVSRRARRATSPFRS